MGSYTIDEAAFPLVRIRYDGIVSDEEFARHLEAYGALVERGARYGVLFDATTAGRPPATQRRMMAEFMRRRRDELARRCVGGAFVITSPLIRGAMTAILWVAPMPFQHVIVSSAAEAEGWVRGRLQAEGLL
ncbi:MAG TPA: hypothetical protein RMH99_23635 [Sandaracinaceae bacterium LLY-WYZ-13_1]|nr:hypothetical protein [Sandaracinaceae bacterium LLY-WYZ-13_1]